MKYEHLTRLAERYRLVLGSRSPRRVKLLTEIGVTFEQIVSRVKEKRRDGEESVDFAERMAGEKARWVAGQVDEAHVVIGCDTVVVLDHNPLGKPTDEADAMRILRLLSGRQHTVCTGVALMRPGRPLMSGYELTDVFFNNVTGEQIHGYIKSGEPMDKAGAYGIQGMGGFLVDRIEGQLDNVIGLPRLLADKLAERMLKNER
jgi:septum formation protein